jgi:hypothetical protein
VEDNIVDTPNHVWSVAIGDADDDGSNEVVIGMMSTTNEVRAYENVAGNWMEDVIFDTPNDVFSVAIGDADNDGCNEVVIGMWSTTNEVRLYEYDLGEIIFTSHKNGDYVSGKICLEVAVTSGSIKEVRFYLNAELEHIERSYPYQYIIDTSELVEDAVYNVKAEAIGNNCSSIGATINITVNNFVQTGDYISVNTIKTFYKPDQEVSVLIGTKSPPLFDSLNLVVSHADPSGNTIYAINESLQYTTKYLVGLPLYSDALLGVYTITVAAYGFDNGALIWNATNDTTFEVLGTNIHEQLESMNASISGMNTSLSDIQSMVTDMRSDLNTLNLSYFQNSIEYLNQTLSNKINELTAQLFGLNDSLLDKIGDAEAIILDELANVNNTLKAQLGDLRAITDNFYYSILNDLSRVLDSLSLVEANLSEQHIAITDAITTLNTTLANAPDLSTDDIMNRINDSIVQIQGLDENMTIHDSDIKAILNTLSVLVENEHGLTRTELLENLTVILSELQVLDANLTTHDQDVEEDLNMVSDLISNLGALDVSELNHQLTDLASNVSEHDTDIGEEIAAIDQSVTDFQNGTTEKLTAINNSLFDLAKLDAIINDLTELDRSLQSAQNDAKSDDSALGFNFMIVIGFLVLMIIILLLEAFVLVRENRILKETLNGAPNDILPVDGDN